MARTRWFVIFIFLIGFGLPSNGVLAGKETGFESPRLLPLRTYLSTDSLIIDPIYQIRFVEFLGSETLLVNASHRGQRSPKNQELVVDLRSLRPGMGPVNAVDQVITLFKDWDDPLNIEDFRENEFWEETGIDPKKVNIRSHEGSYFSAVPGNEIYRWEWIPTSPRGVKPYQGSRPKVFFDAESGTVVIGKASSKRSYRYSRVALSELKDRGLGVIAQPQGQRSEFSVVALEVANGFWDVVKLDTAPPKGRAAVRRLFGPEITSPNKGFIPGTMSLSPAKRPWLAYVGPEKEGGLWGISVWDIDEDAELIEPLAKVGIGQVAYSQHRGFDHRVAWTGPDSILYLENDELTISHIHILSSGNTKLLGQYQFVRGATLLSSGVLSGYSWTQEFELFRLEAVTARSIESGKRVRVALVAIVRYDQDGVLRQTALPLILDLSWNLNLMQ